MKVTTDACLFGAWIAESNSELHAGHVLDIGTGTGLLSMMYAQKNASAVIDAIEIDQEAYKQAKDNVARSKFSPNIRVLHGDVREHSFERKYDVIMSNPPFYEQEIKSRDVKKNVAHHQEGLLLMELLEVIKTNLSPKGNFYLLVPFKRHEEVKKMFLKQDLSLSKILFVKQSTRHDYFRLMIRGNLNHQPGRETAIGEISIWDDQEHYTPEFKSLLKDYYLKLER